jgi:hypothetical protein
LSLEKGSVTPLLLVTMRLAVSTVVKRFWHSGHCLRRRIEEPSSEVRESITLESEFLQNGQCISSLFRNESGPLHREPASLRSRRTRISGSLLAQVPTLNNR